MKSSNSLLVVLSAVFFIPAFAADVPSIPPVDLVRRTVQNEMKSSGDRDKYMYRDRVEKAHSSQTKLMVQTREAMAGIIIAYNDQPLTPEQRQGEIDRIERFIKNPDELKKKQKQEKEDAEHVARIMKALPDAFLYEYDGTQPGKIGVGKEGHELVRLKFHPNPDYDPPSRVEQVLTAMAGTMLIDAVENRIAEIDGTLDHEVSFGWGIFGHLDKGGHFLVQQGDVDKGHWEITRMNLAFTGKILLFKSLNIKSDETATDFRRVANLSFAEGVQALEKASATIGNTAPQNGK